MNPCETLTACAEMEDLFEEIAQEELIEEIEAELEEFLEPEEEELDEQEQEEEPVQEEQTTEEPQQEEIVEVAVVKEPVLVEKKKENSKKKKMREIISNKLKNLATEMGKAVSLEEQQKLQSLVLALLNYNAGFSNYSYSLVDGVFYEDRGIYLDKDIPDNKRGLRNGLANEILHKKLMDLQWQK